jgi:hypothetical protein
MVLPNVGFLGAGRSGFGASLIVCLCEAEPQMRDTVGIKLCNIINIRRSMIFFSDRRTALLEMWGAAAMAASGTQR